MTAATDDFDRFVVLGVVAKMMIVLMPS